MSLSFEMRIDLDQKWKSIDLGELPLSPGVYQFFDSQNTLIYVGKAKLLRRRLAQYKNASRTRKHRKMWRISREAKSIELILCSSEYEAEALETTLIQKHRPRWNVVGAFYFLYPMIGIRVYERHLVFCYTTQPEQGWNGFQFFGAYRSREFTQSAYLSLIKILQYVGHPLKRKDAYAEKIPQFSFVNGLRQIPMEWEPQFQSFFRGESQELLETLVFALLENAGARMRKLEVQGWIEDLLRFWKHEALPLSQVCQKVGYADYPVAQKDRDFLFLKHRYMKRQQSDESSVLSEKMKLVFTQAEV